MEKLSFTLMLLLGHLITFVLCNTTSLQYGLQDDFYSETCPSAESIVRKVTQSHVRKNPDLAAKLLRLHFHDCFVRGCDGSILLNSTANSTSEKDHILSFSLAGFEIIDDIKNKVEEACKGVVSCADIVALAARDAVSFQFKRSLWRVPTGRRDGTVSLAAEVETDTPSPFFFFRELVNLFARKGLSVRDLITLSGAHTIGKSLCSNFDFRLRNFTSRADKRDDYLNPNYADYLGRICTDKIHQIHDRTVKVEMDYGSSRTFDSHYYTNLKHKKGLLFTDAQLLRNGTRLTKQIVDELLQPGVFLQEFAISMQKMGAMDVKTGTQGEIRRKCSLIN